MNKKANGKTIRILCVDDDEDFLMYFKKGAESFNMTFDVCRSVDEGLKKIDSDPYDVFIVDLEFPEKSGFDLIKKIRAKGDFPIVTLSASYNDFPSFNLLKNTYHVNYALNKPILRHQLDKLLSNICKSRIPGKESKEEQLRDYYKSTVVEKIEVLAELVTNAQENPTEKSLNELRDQVHKIGGSAASYGYPEVSKICKHLELELIKKLKSKQFDNELSLLNLNSFLQEIKFYLQIPMTLSIELDVTEFYIQGFREKIYVLSYDENFLNLLQREKKRYSIDLISETDFVQGKQKLLDPEFNPRIVIIEESFPGQPINAFNLIELIKNKPGYLPTLFGIIFKEENLESRIKAVKLGISIAVKKPISPLVLLNYLADTLRSYHTENLRVLLVDDDPDICRIIMGAMNEIGIDCLIFHTAESLYEVLEDFNPHIVLLDVLLPKYDGLSVLRTLRADPFYRELIVIIITHFQDSMVKNIAYGEHVDDVIYKPIDIKLLQKRIVEMARYRVMTEKFTPTKLWTGFDSLSGLQNRIRGILIKKSKFETFLVVFQVNNLDKYYIQHGATALRSLDITISNVILGRTRNLMNRFFVEPSFFYLIFEAEDLESVQLRMHEIFADMRAEVENSITTSSAIIPITESIGNEMIILSLAKDLLMKAQMSKEIVPDRVLIYEIEGRATPKKEIILIDPDQDLQKMIKMAFEPYGIKIHTYTTGSEALEAIYSYNQTETPGLIISERMIPDMDGLELLDKIKARFKQDIPFFFLTVYASEKDIRNGLKHGANEYITKPFSLHLLIQKAVKALCIN